MDIPQAMPRNTRNLALCLLLALVLLSLYLAFSRIYQVDEAQNVYAARIAASHWTDRYFTAVEIWHLWPLSWFAAWVQDSAPLLHLSRAFMVVVFWANLALIAYTSGVRWNSAAFLWALLGVATLTPLWDYGFEIRHENLLLLLLLLFLAVLRNGTGRWLGYLAGALVALMQFTTFKSFAYWLPLLGWFLVFPPGSPRPSRGRWAIQAGAGFVAAAAAVLAVLMAQGQLSLVLNGFQVGLGVTSQVATRFAPFDTFNRLLQQAPLLTGLAAAALADSLWTLIRDGRGALHAEGAWPEAVLLLGSLAALIANPAPHPYNLCLLVPFAFILAVRWSVGILGPICARGGSLRVLVIGVLCVGHVLPSLKANLRHLDMGNERQLQLVRLAESMTDPTADRVYDAAGLVSSRESIGRQWFLHSLVRARIYQGQQPSVKQMLEERPAAVLIPNYRFRWLNKEDIAFIQENYLPLAGDFFVLGRDLNGPIARFRCLHPGRYAIAVANLNQNGNNAELLLDGKPVAVPCVQPLAKGEHTLAVLDDRAISVQWLGPNLTRPPTLTQGHADRFFVNWY